jgi:hypothetical protein
MRPLGNGSCSASLLLAGSAYEVLEYDSAVVEALHLFPAPSQPHVTAAIGDGPADPTKRGTVRCSVLRLLPGVTTRAAIGLLYWDKSTLMCYCIHYTGTSLVSLYELLNKCKTAAGSATLRNWLLRPLRDVAVLQRRQGTVQALVSQPQVLEGLRESRKAGLKAFPDISRLGMSSCANPQCLFNAVLFFPIL